MNFFQNRINAAKAWWSQQKAEGDQYRAALPQVPREQINQRIKQYNDPNIVSKVPMTGAMTKIKYFSPQEIQTGANAFQRQIPRFRPKNGAEKMMDVEKARSIALNKLATFNRLRTPMQGTPEQRFRALIDLYKN